MLGVFGALVPIRGAGCAAKAAPWPWHWELLAARLQQAGIIPLLGEQDGCSTVSLSHLSPFHRCPTAMNTNERTR